MPDAFDTAAVEAFLRRLAPKDLPPSRPLYVLAAADLPADRGRDVKVKGYTYEALDLHLADVIGDRWRGRGPAMVVSAAEVALDCHPDQLAGMVLAVAVHETAHILDPTWKYPRKATRRTAGVPSRPQLALARQLASSVSEPDLPDEPDSHHSAIFVRTGVHLLHRAEALGVFLWASTVVGGGDRKKCFGAERYRVALGDELARMAGASFAAIGKSPVPAALVELWQRERDGLPLPERYRQPVKEKPCLRTDRP